MPNLNQIVIDGDTLKDEETAMLLSSYRHGWKHVDVGTCRGLKDDAKVALMELWYMAAQDLRMMIQRGHSLSVRICTSWPMSLGEVHGKTRAARSKPTFSIDKNPSTDSLRKWTCKTSLKELKVNITGIPRSDCEECEVQEAYPGQGQKIQSQVYDRLARFINLRYCGWREILP